MQQTEVGTEDASIAKKGSRPAYFAEAGGFVETALYDRDKLQAGMRFVGPAIVEERDSTAVIGTDTEVVVDAWGNLIVSFTLLPNCLLPSVLLHDVIDTRTYYTDSNSTLQKVLWTFLRSCWNP